MNFFQISFSPEVMFEQPNKKNFFSTTSNDGHNDQKQIYNDSKEVNCFFFLYRNIFFLALHVDWFGFFV